MPGTAADEGRCITGSPTLLTQISRSPTFEWGLRRRATYNSLTCNEKWCARQDSNLRHLPSESTRSTVSNCFVYYYVAVRPLQLQHSAHRCMTQSRKSHAIARSLIAKQMACALALIANPSQSTLYFSPFQRGHSLFCDPHRHCAS